MIPLHTFFFLLVGKLCATKNQMCFIFNQELYLRNNELEQIPPDLFKNMAKLSRLVLSGNRLKTLDANMFAPIPGTTTILPFISILQELSSDVYQ